jgi:hypothetical protein
MSALIRLPLAIIAELLRRVSRETSPAALAGQGLGALSAATLVHHTRPLRLPAGRRQWERIR